MDTDLEKRFMTEALRQAHKAFEMEEVPVGVVIVHEKKIIARAYNQTNTLKDPTAHAEMIAITQAASYLKHERLLDTELYSTIEPCPMCLGAIIHARIPRVYYGAPNDKYGACGSIIDLMKDGKKWNHDVKITSGLLKEEASSLIQHFFKSKRQVL